MQLSHIHKAVKATSKKVCENVGEQKHIITYCSSLLLLILIMLPWCLKSQNLVQNPGFEINTGLPNQLGQWDLATNWNNANTQLASPDYYHVNGGGNVQLPNNIVATVNPFQGDAVIGLVAYYPTNNDYREYISQTLASPLVVGNSYTFSFYVVNGMPNNYGGMGIENLGVDFSVNPYVQNGFNPFGYTPLLSNGNMLYGINWVQISYTFIATQAYTNFCIGNFNVDANTVGQLFNPSPSECAYYFIDEVSLTLDPSNLLITGNTQICVGDSTTLQVTNSSSYAWADSSNPTVILSYDSIFTVSPLNTTTYYVYGDTDTNMVTINVIFPNSLNLGNDTTLCEGSTLFLYSNVANATYLWQDSSVSPTYPVTQAGTYYLQVAINSCVLSDTIVVNYIAYPIVNLGNDTAICEGSQLLLNAAVNNAGYLWQNGSTNATFLASQEGWYSVTVSLNNCDTSDSILISEIPLPELNLGNDTILCKGDELILNQGTANATYQWQNNSNDSIFVIQEQGIYWLSITVNNCTKTDSLLVKYSNLNSFSLGNDTSICSENELVLKPDIDNAAYLWQNNSNAETYTVADPGTYWVTIKQGNCTVSDTIIIDTLLCTEIIEMPNIFTPNNDGINDFFEPLKINGIQDAGFEIFNRWGQMLLNTNGLNLSWDGKSNGVDCVPGVYFWVINYTNLGGESKKITGFLTLMK